MKNTFALIFGFFLILLGLSFLFNIFHIFNFADYVLRLWPLLLIIWGLRSLSRGRFYWGIILIALALLFLINNFSLVSFNVFVIFWPVLIILLGLSVIIRAFKKDSVTHEYSTDASPEVIEKGKSINETNVLGDKNVKINSTATDGGSVVNVLGATKLDLTECKSGKHGAILEIVNVLGETTILVPSDMNIKLDSVPILGSINDQRKLTKLKNGNEVMLIKCVAVMGAINIK